MPEPAATSSVDALLLAIVEELARRRKARRKALPAVRIRKSVTQRWLHSALLNHYRNLLRGLHLAGFLETQESSRMVKMLSEIGAVLPWPELRYLQRHRSRSVQTVPRRRCSQSHLHLLPRGRWMTGSPMPGPQLAREEAGEPQQLNPVRNAHLQKMDFRLLDDPGYCRSRHNSLRVYCVARYEDESKNAFLRPKLP